MSKSTTQSLEAGERRRLTLAEMCGRPEDGWRVVITGGVFLLVYIGSLVAIRWEGMPESLRIPAALIPVLGFGAFLWALIRSARSLDELQRRIQLEALAFAFPMTMLLLFTLGLLERVATLPPQDLGYRHVWAMLPMLYFAGLILAIRRYH